MWDTLRSKEGLPEETPKEKIVAMGDLLWDFELSGVAKVAAEMRQDREQRRVEGGERSNGSSNNKE